MMSELSHLRWRCRRGMKELDVLLEGYLINQFCSASPENQRTFSAMLELSDPTLLAYILGHEQPDTEEQRLVIASLRRASRT